MPYRDLVRFQGTACFFVPPRRAKTCDVGSFCGAAFMRDGVKLSHFSHFLSEELRYRKPGLKKHAGTIFSASPLMISFRGLEKLRLQIDEDLGLSLEVVVTISKTAGSFWRMINYY